MDTKLVTRVMTKEKLNQSHDASSQVTGEEQQVDEPIVLFIYQALFDINFLRIHPKS